MLSTQVKNPGQRSHPQNWNVIDKIGASARKGHRVSETRARTTDLGFQFLCFWVTLGIAYMSPFVIFAIGGANDELKVRASSDKMAVFFGIWLASNSHGGLPKTSLILDQLFQNNLIKNDFP